MQFCGYDSNTTYTSIMNHNVLISFFATGIPTLLMKQLISLDTVPVKLTTDTQKLSTSRISGITQSKLLNEAEGPSRLSNLFPLPLGPQRTLMPWMLMQSNSPKSSPQKNMSNVQRRDSVSAVAEVDIWWPLALPSLTPSRNPMSNVPEKKKSSSSSRKLKSH